MPFPRFSMKNRQKITSEVKGKLYIVPTPVGNLEDMSPRAVKVLKEADMIYAEDTRTTGIILRHFDISSPLSSFHKFNEHQAVGRVMARLGDGERIALVSDAGTPGISDPGFLLGRACRDKGIPVETLPGPTAFVPALVDSGLPCDKFFFEGFLPAKKGRKARLQFLSGFPYTFIVYESPLRLVRTLEEFSEVCGEDRGASVAREISKLHETITNGTLAELVEFFSLNNPKGEIVIVVEGKSAAMPKKTHRNKYRGQETEDMTEER